MKYLKYIQYKVGFNKYLNNCYYREILFDYNIIKQEIYNKKLIKSKLIYLLGNLKKKFLNYIWVEKEIMLKIRNCFELNDK